MAINKVGSKGIADGAVATADLQDNVVTSAKLGDGEVTNAKLANTTVTLAGQSITLGSSGSINNKFIDWQSVVVSDGSTVTTMVAGNGYFVNNTSAAGLVKLPISASIGDVVAIKDYAGNFGTNSLTIQRNGHNIQGVANDSLISTNRASLVLVYVDATKGWIYWEEHNVGDLGVLPEYVAATGGTVTTSGDYKIHSFTGDGCFVVSSSGFVTPAGGSDSVSYIVLAGGGAGARANGGGGGAGGYREGKSASDSFTSSPLNSPGGLSVSSTTYPVTIGAGGSGNSTPGSTSIFSTITSAGGGGGGGSTCGSTAAQPGGSGGGSSNGVASGGTGNTPPVSPPQGNPGGSSDSNYGPQYPSSGGGGAGAAGANVTGPSDTAGAGGNGVSTTITGSSITRAGGGGGSSRVNGGPGGSGGGATGGGSSVNGQSASANTGGGGGGSQDQIPGAGGSGGSGIVIIRYKFQ